jgi:zinc protease
VTARHAVASWLAILGVAGTAAQPFDTPPPVAPPRPLTIAPPTVATLDNGLRVVVARRPGLPLVTAELLVRSGAETDPPALAGLANLTATLLVKGTATRAAPEIAEAAEALGGALDSGAGWNRSFITITVARPMLPAALDLVADAALRPRFAGAELERARKLAIDGLAVALAQPGTLSQVAASRAAFGAGTFGHSASGTPASLARIRRANVVALHARLFRPDNATLVVAGDIDMADARALAQRAFGRWARPARAMAASVVTGAQPVLKAPVVIDMKDSGQAGVALATPSIARTAPDYYAGVVANTLVGGGYSSRLNQEIRIKRGLSYGIGSALDARRGGGVFHVEVQTKNPSAPEVLDLTVAELARAAATAAPADELEARKLAVIGAVSRRFETTEGLASMVAALEAYGVDVAEVTRVIERLAAVTPAEVQAFVQAHWPAGALQVVVAGEAAQFAEALRKTYPDLVVIPQADVDLERAGLSKWTDGLPVRAAMPKNRVRPSFREK